MMAVPPWNGPPVTLTGMVWAVLSQEDAGRDITLLPPWTVFPAACDTVTCRKGAAGLPEKRSETSGEQVMVTGAVTRIRSVSVALGPTTSVMRLSAAARATDNSP